MRSIRLAYRDNDRTPVIFCIREMARRHYDIDVEVIRCSGTSEFEATLLDGACDVIIEHLEYLYAEAARGRKVTFFCAPSKGGGLDLVVAPHITQVDALKGGRMAVRTSGQPHAVTLWLRMMGLEHDVKTLPVPDREVGRWAQWKKVESGECIAAFISGLYLPPALAAGLKILKVPDVPIIGHFAQACLSRFAQAEPGLLKDYIKATIHAVCLMLYRRSEALSIVSGEPMKRMNICDPQEMERQFDSITAGLKPKPYPTPQAIANTYEIATLEYADAKGLNPLSLWDLHWVKQLDDEGYVDGLVERMTGMG